MSDRRFDADEAVNGTAWREFSEGKNLVPLAVVQIVEYQDVDNIDDGPFLANFRSMNLTAWHTLGMSESFSNDLRAALLVTDDDD